MTIFKKAGKGTSMKTTSVMTTAPKRGKGRPRKMTEEVIVVTTTATAPKGKAGRPKGSTNKSSAPQKARRVSKKMA
jgi:hypothetical protein